MSTPSSLAPMSTLASDRMSTRAHAMRVHTYQGQSRLNVEFIVPPTTAPKNPKIASWMAM